MYYTCAKYRVVEYYRVCRFIDVILELKLRHYVDKDCLPKKSCKEIVYANILYQFHSKGRPFNLKGYGFFLKKIF